MSFDMMLGIALGLCVAAFVFIKLLSWAVLKAAHIVGAWIYRAL